MIQYVGCSKSQMFCAEDGLPQAIMKSELVAPTPAAACLHVVPLRFTERSQGRWQGEPRRIYLNESQAMVNGIVQRTPWYSNSGGRDHIWILAYSNPKPPAEFIRRGRSARAWRRRFRPFRDILK